MRTLIIASAAAVLSLSAASCGSASSTPSTPIGSTATNPPTQPAPPACPIADGGTCLGKLTAGLHTSITFSPKMTFQAPGWVNYLDVPGLYLLQPPGSKPPGDSIAGSFIGVATSSAAEAPDCQSNLTDVPATPTALATWMSHQRGLDTSRPRPVTVGGLKGETLTIRMAKGAKGCLSAGATKPGVPLLVGVGGSSFDHEIPAGIAERDYLLGYQGGTLSIEVIDASGGHHLAAYSQLVQQFQFHT